MAKLTPEQMDYYETEMRRLETDDNVSKQEHRLFMQSSMACGHAVGNLLTCDSPPEGCVICNGIDRLTAELESQQRGEIVLRAGLTAMQKLAEENSDKANSLTFELAVLKDECTCEECEQSLEDKETGVTAICIACWNKMITKLRKEIDRLTAENEKEEVTNGTMPKG